MEILKTRNINYQYYNIYKMIYHVSLFYYTKTHEKVNLSQIGY